MIVGYINAYREAVVRFPLLLAQRQHEVEAVLDTGFNGHTLQIQVIDGGSVTIERITS